MRPRLWSSLLVLGLSSALQASATGISPITDIKITACPENNCSVPGYRKVAQDLNKYSRGSFVHLHFTDLPTPQGCSNVRLNPITNIAVLQGPDAEMGPHWEKIEGNLNDGNRGPVLTMFVQRDPDDSPIDSVVVKYGYDSHAAIGYDRLPLDLNVGTGGQWVHLYYRKEGYRPPITHIATKACPLPRCSMDDSWTRANRPIVTGTFKRYLYLFYKSVPGERPITTLNLSLRSPQADDEDDGALRESIDTGVRFKDSNVYVNYRRGRLGEHKDVLDNLAVELGNNPVPYGWNLASFDHDPEEEVPDWNAQIVYRTGEKVLPKVPTLKFKDDGSFKIVQFADIHMATGPHTCYNAPSSMTCTGDINTSEMMERVLEAERPDLVVFTGDNVNGMTSNDAYSTILKYSKPVVERGIPWTIIFGNHDEEGDLSREEMMRSVQDVPFSIAERGPAGISGTGNFVLQIHRRDRRQPRRHRHHRPSFDTLIEDNEHECDHGEELDEDIETFDKEKNGRFTLYFLDSGAYSFNLAYPGYDWIKEDQVEWFRQTSQAITSRYPKDKVPNALAFFHIPIPEYALVDDDNDDNDHDDDDGEDGLRKKENGKMVGDKVEGVSSPSYNSGMFDAIFESKDVRATTVGHDHLNDYCLDHRGIELCFGGGLGYGSYGRGSIYRRSRVFEILKNGDRVDTWKRLDDDELTIVGQQTLFEGPKVHDSSSPSERHSRPDNQKGQRQRQIDDLLERLRQGTQIVMGGGGGSL
ncbi:MAG: Metallo-dependent phosphatase-like protein [Linnemannia elongata]|nr:MAG: Metallo-dependent phosphatase-like protein [Linnemannia elongata]